MANFWFSMPEKVHLFLSWKGDGGTNTLKVITTRPRETAFHEVREALEGISHQLESMISGFPNHEWKRAVILCHCLSPSDSGILWWEPQKIRKSQPKYPPDRQLSYSR